MSLNQIYDSVTLKVPSVVNKGLYVKTAAMRMISSSAWLFLHSGGTISTISLGLSTANSPTMSSVTSSTTISMFYILYNIFNSLISFPSNGSIVRTNSATVAVGSVFTAASVNIPDTPATSHVITVNATLRHMTGVSANDYTWVFKGGFQVKNFIPVVITTLSSSVASLGPVVGTPTVTITTAGPNYFVQVNSGNATGTSDNWNVSVTITAVAN